MGGKLSIMKRKCEAVNQMLLTIFSASLTCNCSFTGPNLQTNGRFVPAGLAMLREDELDIFIVFHYYLLLSDTEVW